MESRLNVNPNPESSHERWDTATSGPHATGEFSHAATMLSDKPATPRSRGRIWARRLFMVVLVLFCIELGMALVVLPWLSVWTANSLVQSYPQLQSFLGNYFVRGAFTGLGLIDIWIGVWEAVHYRDNPEP